MSTVKALVSKVQFGTVEVEGLLLPDGSFGVAVTEANNLLTFSAHQNHASRQVKALLGEGFQPTKVASELNPNAVVVLTLAEFELLVRKLDRAGNKKAQELVDACVGLSFVQRFSDAFGVKFEKAERDLWLEARKGHRESFHPLYTQWLKSDQPNRKDYGAMVDKIKTYAGVPLIPVEEYSASDLKKLENAYVIYDNRRRRGESHWEALKNL